MAHTHTVEPKLLTHTWEQEPAHIVVQIAIPQLFWVTEYFSANVERKPPRIQSQGDYGPLA